MKNKNMLKIKKVNEERYFRNYHELYTFVLKQNNLTDESFNNLCRNCNNFHEKVLRQMLSKETERFIILESFKCLLSEGFFERSSGIYQYNILSIERI